MQTQEVEVQWHLAKHYHMQPLISLLLFGHIILLESYFTCKIIELVYYRCLSPTELVVEIWHTSLLFIINRLILIIYCLLLSVICYYSVFTFYCELLIAYSSGRGEHSWAVPVDSTHENCQKVRTYRFWKKCKRHSNFCWYMLSWIKWFLVTVLPYV